MIINYFLTLFLIFCPSVYAQKNKTIDHDKQKKTLNLLTFNAGLAHSYVPYASLRREKIIEALKEGNSDIVCLQEVWTEDDRKEFIEKLKDQFPYIHASSIIQKRASQKPVCQVFELFGENKYGRCMVSKCLKQAGDSLTQCLLEKCQGPLLELKISNNDCANALLAQVGKSIPVALYHLFTPFSFAGIFAYEGSDGLLLLSKYPIEKKELFNWDDLSTINKRSTLFAEIKIKNKNHSVLCTHLTANLEKDVPYVGKNKSWEYENSLQIDQLIKFTKGLSPPVYLMGDFNCSIKIKSAQVDPDFEKNCQKLFSKFSSPVLNINPQCTFCRDNLLNSGKGEGNLMIDHIFLNEGIPKKVDIAFKEKIMIKEEEKEIETQLSDHYGVSLQLGHPSP